MCDILLRSKTSKPSKEQKEYISDIFKNNERMIKLINDLLDVSHIETGRNFEIIKKETDIVKIVNQILADNKQLLLERKINIIKCEGAPKEFFINIDGEKIGQAYNNLINNAIKYSKMGGVVEIGCEHREKSVLFIIADHGIGIPQEQQGKIFDKFFRADNALLQETDGTGLGLYIAKSIIEAHKGKL
jgi:signal transduction histidine kinase